MVERLQRAGIVALIVLGAALCVFVVWLLIVNTGHEVIDPREAREVFQQEFGFAPPATVTDIKSNYFENYGRGRRYMRFRCDPATYQKIVAQGFTVSRELVWVSSSDRGNVPLWWDHSFSRPTDVGSNGSWHSKFAVTQAVVTRDPRTGKVYFFWYGSPKPEAIDRIDAWMARSNGNR